MDEAVTHQFPFVANGKRKETELESVSPRGLGSPDTCSLGGKAESGADRSLSGLLCKGGGGWRFQGTPVLHPHTWNDACPVPSTLLVLVVAHARPRPADLQPGALLVDKVKPSLVSCRVQEAE